MKVLIVDDSPDALVIAKARLVREDLEIVCAENGACAIELARSENPDLILLDIDMPGMSGFDVCRILKEEPELQMIPIIFLTGSDDTQDRVRGLDFGAVDYVTKPFDAFELRARVRAALRTKRFQDMLIQCANIDPLTELPNRRALMERLEQEWDRCRRYGNPLSVVMVDLDHFKNINDTYGHQMGDRLLRATAEKLDSQRRSSDFAGRYGGEEFMILAPENDAQNAATLAERCRQAIQDITLLADKEQVHITASFGVADSRDASDIESLIRSADEALYRAKGLGRNRVETSVPVEVAAAPDGEA